jgi:hypothetical protein
LHNLGNLKPGRDTVVKGGIHKRGKNTKAKQLEKAAQGSRVLTQADFCKSGLAKGVGQGKDSSSGSSSGSSSVYGFGSSSETSKEANLSGITKRDPGVYTGKSSSLFAVDDSGLVLPIDDKPFWHPILERVLDYRSGRFFDPVSGKPVQLDASVLRLMVHPQTKAKLHSAEEALVGEGDSHTCHNTGVGLGADIDD